MFDRQIQKYTQKPLQYIAKLFLKFISANHMTLIGFGANFVGKDAIKDLADGAKHLAEDINTKFLGEIPLVQSIREAGDVGHPVALQENTSLENAFATLTKEMVSELLKRNANLPPTEVVRITTMSGCSAVKK